MTKRNHLPIVRDTADRYIDQIRAIPVLSREEEYRLATLWFRDRDRDAGQKLVISNLRFVVKIAREYVRYGFKFQDLIQEGNMGLLHALDKFDPRKGYRLISYAVWWIRAYIQAYVLKSWSIVRIGTTRVQRKIVASLQKARQKIAALNASEAVNTKELAGELDVSESDLRETVQLMQKRDVSLDAPVTRESNAMTVSDTLADQSMNAEEQMILSDTQEKVRQTLDQVYEDLTPRERYLLENRLMADIPATLEAVGHEFGITRERVRQIEERLKGKLKIRMAPAIAAPAV